MCVLTIDFIRSESTLMLGSDGLVLLRASLSSASFAASVGKLGRISFIQPAGMFLFAAFRMFFLKVRSPVCTSDGSGVSCRSSSSCVLKPSQFALAKFTNVLFVAFDFVMWR